MTLFRKNAFGLDISDCSIEVLEIDKKLGKLKVLSYGRVEIPEGIVRDGIILQKDKLVESIKKALKESQPRPIKNTNVILSLPESKVFTHVFEFPSNLNDEQIAESLPYEAEKIIPYNQKQLYYDFQVIERKDKVKEVFYAACPQEIVDSFLEVLEEASLNPIAFDMESQAQARALLGDLTLELEGVLMADMGARTTILSIFDHHGIRLTANIPYAGHKLTEAVAKKLKTSLDEAEESKKEVGIEAKAGQKNKVYLACEPILKKIISEIKSNIKYYKKQTGYIINEVILCGGSSLLPGIEIYFSQQLGLKVGRGNPLEGVSFDPKIFKEPEAILYSTVMGLALRGANKDPEKEGINLLYKKEKAKRPKSEKKEEKIKPPVKNKKRLIILLTVFIVLILVFGSLILWKKPFSVNNNKNVNKAVATGETAKPAKIDLELILEVNTVGIVSETQIAGQILEKEIGKSKTFATTGSKTIKSKATGRVTIYNNSIGNQPLVATTRLLTSDNILYRLKDYVVVPAEGSVEADIYADQAGAEYEIGPTNFTIPGLSASMQKLIYAESTAATTGGSQEIKFLTQEDLNKAQKDLKEEITKEAIENLKKEILKGQILLEEIINQEIVSSSASHNVDTEIKESTLTLKIKNQALQFSQVDLINKLKEQLVKQIPTGQKVENYTIGSFQYSFAQYDKEKGIATIQVKAEAQ